MPMEMMPAPESEELLPEPEASFENEAVMEEFQEERAGLYSKIMKNKWTERLILATPGIDIPALGVFAARGEGLDGRKLDPRERLNYVMIAGYLSLAYILLFSGMDKEAVAARSAAWKHSGGEFGPELLNEVKSAAVKAGPSMASFVEKTNTYINKKKDVAKEIWGSMMDPGANPSDLIALNLDE